MLNKYAIALFLLVISLFAFPALASGPIVIVDGTSNAATAYPGQNKLSRTSNGPNNNRTFALIYDGSNLSLRYTDEPDASTPVWNNAGVVITTATHYNGELTWDQTNNVLYLAYGRDTHSDSHYSDIYYRRISNLSSSPILGPQQVAFNATTKINYSRPHVEVCGDNGVNKICIFADKHNDAHPPGNISVVTGTLNSDDPTFDPVYHIRSIGETVSTGLLGVTRMNNNKLAIFYHSSNFIVAIRHDDSSDIQSIDGWDALDGTNNYSTWLADAAIVNLYRSNGSVVGSPNSDALWFAWNQGVGPYDIRTQYWNGSSFSPAQTVVNYPPFGCNGCGPSLYSDGINIHIVYVKVGDNTQLVYQSRPFNDGVTPWSGSENLIEDSTEPLLYPSVAPEIAPGTLNVVYTSQLTQQVRFYSN